MKFAGLLVFVVSLLEVGLHCVEGLWLICCLLLGVVDGGVLICFVLMLLWLRCGLSCWDLFVLLFLFILGLTRVRALFNCCFIC